MDDNEFLAMLDEMLLAPDTIIRKEWVKRLVETLKEKDGEIERLRGLLREAEVKFDYYHSNMCSKTSMFCS